MLWQGRKFAVKVSRKLMAAATVAALVMVVAIARSAPAGDSTANRGRESFLDPYGIVTTVSTAGSINKSSAFFQSLGTNGRDCSTCHVPGDAYGLSARHAQQVFRATRGDDPLFASVDGGNCPDVTKGDAAGHSLMLRNGLLRVSLPVPQPPVAQYTISVVRDPYGCALVTDASTGQQMISVYRRPLPSTNLRFLSAVMFDGRETVAPLNNPATFLANLKTDLTSQALDATMGHAQAAHPPSAAQLADIVDFEMALSSAQQIHIGAGPLDGWGARGGAEALSQAAYYPGINDSLGSDPTGASFDPNAMAVFNAWSGANDNPTRQMIAAGETLFNSFPLKITAVRGLNDNPALGNPAVIVGTCSTCHDAPNVGDHSLPLPLDIGTSNGVEQEGDAQIAAALAQLSAPDLPLYRVTCIDPASPEVGQVFYTSDPGKALIPKDGVAPCTDINRIKGPVLRGLAARAPYFHNGSAADLKQVVDFYNQRFQMGLTAQQKAQLVAFLQSL